MKRTAQAVWSGGLKDGNGAISLQSGALKDSPYTFKARFEDESGKSATNPEELIAAAHASCFTMQLSFFLQEAGHPAAKLTTSAEVTVGRSRARATRFRRAYSHCAATCQAWTKHSSSNSRKRPRRAARFRARSTRSRSRLTQSWKRRSGYVPDTMP